MSPPGGNRSISSIFFDYLRFSSIFLNYHRISSILQSKSKNIDDYHQTPSSKYPSIPSPSLKFLLIFCHLSPPFLIASFFKKRRVFLLSRRTSKYTIKTLRVKGQNTSYIYSAAVLPYTWYFTSTDPGHLKL